MTRKEIVKALRECSSGNMNCSKCPMWDSKLDLRCMDVAMKYAADMLEQDAKKTNWISVKDRLPKETQDCASGVKIKSHSELCIVAIETEESTFYVQTDITVCGKWYNYGNRITHWMPLPEPPKEEAK